MTVSTSRKCLLQRHNCCNSTTVNLKVLFLFIAFISLSFQEPEYQPGPVIPGKTDMITTDNLGNLYTVRNDVISKYSSNGSLLQTYSNKSFGQVTLIDASNPMKPMLFYRDLAQVVFLDNMMAQQGSPVRFAEEEFPDVQLAAVSRENGMWIYVSQNSELIRLNEQLQITHRTGNLAQLLGADISPDHLVEHNNKVYLNSPLHGILIFDVFGTYYKTVPIKQLQTFQVQDDEIVYLDNNKLHSYNIKTLEGQEYALPISPALSIRIEKQRLYVRKPEAVHIYNVK